MGSGIVKNLLNSGHNVTVWNRTTEKVGAVFIQGTVPYRYLPTTRYCIISLYHYGILSRAVFGLGNSIFILVGTKSYLPCADRNVFIKKIIVKILNHTVPSCKNSKIIHKRRLKFNLKSLLYFEIEPSFQCGTVKFSFCRYGT